MRGFILIVLIVLGFGNLAHLSAELAFGNKRAVLASKLYPWDYRYRFNVAGLYAVRKEWRQAEREYRATLKLFPGFIEAESNLAVVWAMTGRMRQAERLLLRVLAADPGYVSARHNLMQIRNGRLFQGSPGPLR